MTVHVALDPAGSPDDGREKAENFSRLAGRRLIDLTGNGPPTRSERRRQRLRLMKPHPRYLVVGQCFISDAGGAGRLMATVTNQADLANPALKQPMVLVQTVTSSNPDAAGVDGDFHLYLDGSLFGVTPERAWADHSADQVAQKLAQIGRLLAYAEVTDRYRLNTHPHLILSDKPSSGALLTYTMRAALAASGRDSEGEWIYFQPRTPIDPPKLEFIGFDAELSPMLKMVLDTLSEPQLKVSFTDRALRVSPNALRLSVDTVNIVDRMKMIGTVTDIYEKKGWKAQDLLLLDGEDTIAA